MSISTLAYRQEVPLTMRTAWEYPPTSLLPLSLILLHDEHDQQPSGGTGET